MLTRGCPWVLCIDSAHRYEMDLMNPALRAQIDDLIDRMAFLVVGGGPPCSSLSIAVCPPVRSKQFPAGRPDLPMPARRRVRIGNVLAAWTAPVYRRCVGLDIAVWAKNLDASWMWRLRSWKAIREN